LELPFTPRRTPFSHQQRLLEESALKAEFALFWEQGTGKTKGTIDTAAGLFARGLVRGMLVVAPNGVHRNWVSDELPAHWPEDLPPLRALSWSSTSAETVWHRKAVADLLKDPGPVFMAMSYDQLMTKAGTQAAWDLLRGRPCLYVLDESARVKTPSAKRTHKVQASGRYAPYRRILTGTPVANSPFDVYSQVRFLDPDFWVRELRIGSYGAFKARFGRWMTVQDSSGRFFPKLLAYQDLDVLERVLSTISDRVLKDQVLDLPPKVYQRRYHAMEGEQARMYRELKQDLITFLNSGEMVTAEMAIVKLLRLQQVCCGFITLEDRSTRVVADPNPRAQLLEDILGDLTRPSIIWGRFQRDIDEAAAASKRAGRRPVTYDGRTSEADRKAALDAFHAGEADDFIANPAAAGEGLTLTEADTVIYYSNSFNLTHRLQSEDRAHRIGQTRSVTYIDLLAEDTVDSYILKALQAKRDVASTVLGDELKEWLNA
jgi:SNF2 family DNA or RNA helicase